jgi:maleylpyruvate isomerase
MRPDADVIGCSAAHALVLRTIEGLRDDDARRPSLLPDWSVGHVLTHLARNADSHVHMIDGALLGEVRWQYPSPDARERDIEAGAGRPAAALVEDVRASFARLEEAWAGLADDTWRDGRSRSNAGEFAIAEQVFRRWGEVEVHHSDLGFGFTTEDWSDAYVAKKLPLVVAELRADGVEVPVADDRRVLAWVLGRSSEPSWPDIGRWR